MRDLAGVPIIYQRAHFECTSLYNHDLVFLLADGIDYQLVLLILIAKTNTLVDNLLLP